MGPAPTFSWVFWFWCYLLGIAAAFLSATALHSVLTGSAFEPMPPNYCFLHPKVCEVAGRACCGRRTASRLFDVPPYTGLGPQTIEETFRPPSELLRSPCWIDGRMLSQHTILSGRCVVLEEGRTFAL